MVGSELSVGVEVGDRERAADDSYLYLFDFIDVNVEKEC
jgi:hypothetical protein